MSAEENPKTWADEIAEWERAWRPILEARGEVEVEDPEEKSGDEEPGEQWKPSYFGNANAGLTAPED